MKLLVRAALPASFAILLGMARTPPEKKAAAPEETPMSSADPSSVIVSAQDVFPFEWKGGQSSIHAETVKIISKSPEWDTLWRDAIGAEPPAVDFTRYTAAAVFLGIRNTGGYGIEFLAPVLENGSAVVSYKEKPPAPGSFAIQAFTQPFAIRLYKKSNLPIEARALRK